MENVKQEGTFKMPAKKKPEPIQTEAQQRAARMEPLINTNQEIPKVVISDNQEVVENEVVEEKEEAITMTEVTKEETPVVEEVVEEAPQTVAPQSNLPENLEKLVSFMNDTGGDIQDYVRLNTNYDDVDKNVLVKEYYKNTKPHLSSEEIDFVIEDSFSFDEETDDGTDIRKKKIAYKEEVAKARKFLTETKDKYYDEIKLRSSDVNPAQKEAVDFFDRFKKNEAEVSQNQETFKANTKKLFSQEFEGFDYNVGDKTFRMSVPNVDKVSEQQQDIGNFISKFTGNSGTVEDTKGYHKALYVANNPDKMANHFYEQGKADAIRELTNKSNNVSTDARKAAPQGDVMMGKWKIKGVSDGSSSKLKIKKF